jgi:hypothetical protein
MSLRERLADRLCAFYEQRGLSVGDKFSCVHAGDCIRDAGDRMLTHGAEAHLGTSYGTALRVVVVSLDTGGGSDDLENRTRIIENLPGTELNAHMRGTRAITRELLYPDIGEDEPYPYFAMINAAKCSGADRKRDMVPDTLYERCRPYALEELQLLAPEVVVTQGQRGRAVLPPGERPVRESVDALAHQLGTLDWVAEWLWALTSRYLKWISVGEGPALAVITPHPSARGGQWQRFAALDMGPLAWLVRHIVGTCTG